MKVFIRWTRLTLTVTIDIAMKFQRKPPLKKKVYTKFKMWNEKLSSHKNILNFLFHLEYKDRNLFSTRSMA